MAPGGRGSQQLPALVETQGLGITILWYARILGLVGYIRAVPAVEYLYACIFEIPDDAIGIGDLFFLDQLEGPLQEEDTNAASLP